MTVIGVLGGSGGVGASSFAAVLAAAAVSTPGAGGVTLIDLDPVGGGIDVLLGIEDLPGARWSGVRLSGGHLDPDALARGLPTWRRVAVLAADVGPPSADAVAQVIETAALLDSDAEATVVLDLPRAPSAIRDTALACCDLAVVVVAAQLRPLIAAMSTLRTLGEVPAGVVLRRGTMATDEALRLLGCTLFGVVPRSFGRPRTEHGDRGLRSCRTADQIARGLLIGLPVRVGEAS